MSILLRERFPICLFLCFIQKYSIENKFQIELEKISVLYYHSKINAKSVSFQKTSLEFRVR